MNRPLALHLKAALICALIGIVLALPLLWAPMLPAWQGWRPPVISPRVEAIIAILMALWVAWCVVDIPRRSLKILIWLATLWLLGGGIWLANLYGHPSSSLVPLTAVGLAGAVALAFSFTPAGSRRARWQSLVGGRVAPEFLRARIDERHLEDGPRSEVLSVAEVLWPGHAEGEGHAAWQGLPELTTRAVRHFHQSGGYLERCDGEGALFAFGLWGQSAPTPEVVHALWQWVKESGGCAALTRGECVTGVGRFPSEARWTVNGSPLLRARRMAAAARGYAAGLLVDDALTGEFAEGWQSRRMAWWDFDGQRILLHEVTGPSGQNADQSADDERRWDRAWDAFWEGRWAEAENAFAALARERDDAAARVFALRSAAARRSAS
jgi:hypothetical protein